MGRQLRAVRWPPKVEPYVLAMTTTDMAADVRCSRAEVAAGNYTAETNVSSSADCNADQGTNASEIRSLLGLPPPG